MANGFRERRLTINGAKNPCTRECERRSTRCHTACRDYAEYREKCEENRKKRWMKTDVDHAVTLAVKRCADNGRR